MRKKKEYKGRKSFFNDSKGHAKYNKICMKCSRKCKQSFRAVLISCPAYSRIEDDM